MSEAAQGDEARFRAIGQELLEAIDRAIEPWIDGLARTRHAEVGPDVLRVVAAEVRQDVGRRLGELVAQPPTGQRANPLHLLRSATGPITDMLDAAGVPPAERDEFERRIAPDDRHALGPMTWSDLGDRVAETGMAWSAAKAFVLRADRP